MKLTEATDVDTVKAFITQITGIIGDKSPSESDSDSKEALLPKEDAFKALISKLTSEKQSTDRSSSGDDRSRSTSKSKLDRRELLKKVFAEKEATPSPEKSEPAESEIAPSDAE